MALWCYFWSWTLYGNRSCQREQNCLKLKASRNTETERKDKEEVSLPTFIYLYCYHMFCMEHWQLLVMLLEKKNSSQQPKNPLTVKESAKRHEPKKFLPLGGAYYVAGSKGAGQGWTCLLPPTLVSQGFALPPPPSLARGSREKENEHEGTEQVKATTELGANWFVCWIFQDVHTALINLYTFFPWY